MKTLLISIIVLACITAQGQTYIAKSGDTLRVGDKLKIGIGSLANGGYRFIEGILHVPEPGSRLTIRKIFDHGNKKAGYQTFIRIGFGKSIASWDINIEYALKTGEVELFKE